MSLATRQQNSKINHRLSSSKFTSQLSLRSSTREVAAHELERGRLTRAGTERPVVYAYLALCRLSFRPRTSVPNRSSVAFGQAPTTSAIPRQGAIFKPVLPLTNRATAERRLEQSAQPRPNAHSAPQIYHVFGQYFVTFKNHCRRSCPVGVKLTVTDCESAWLQIMVADHDVLMWHNMVADHFLSPHQNTVADHVSFFVQSTVSDFQSGIQSTTVATVVWHHVNWATRPSLVIGQTIVHTDLCHACYINNYVYT